ncbi:MAG: DeoR family transcriptional regulator [Acidobacteriota bacterium]
MKRTAEVWDRGSDPVTAMCKNHEVALPTFEERSGCLMVTFRAQMVKGSLLNEGSQEATQNSSQKGSQKSTQEIIDLIRQQPSITIERLSLELGISDRAVKKHLRNLKEQGLLNRTGPDKDGHCEVVG